MPFQHGKPLHQQVASRIRREYLIAPEDGLRLPSDGELATRWRVSVRTIREALLLLEAEGRVERRRGSGTYVRAVAAKPVAIFSELDLLHPHTPKFFGLTLDLVRRQLGEAGIETRLYTGRSQAGDAPGAFTCPELLADAEAGRLAGIVAITSALSDPRLAALRQAGMPMVAVTGSSELSQRFSPQQVPELAVPYLAQAGRQRIGLIGWAPSAENSGRGGQVLAFQRALAAHDLPFHAEWCRVDLSFAWRGAGWEEFREIWSARDEKPDAVVISDENYLPEVVMAVLQLGLRVPQDVLLVSHKVRFVDYPLPVPVAWAEMNVEAFAAGLVQETLAALRGEPPPVLPVDVVPYRLRRLDDTAVPAPATMSQDTHFPPTVSSHG